MKKKNYLFFLIFIFLVVIYSYFNVIYYHKQNEKADVLALKSFEKIIKLEIKEKKQKQEKEKKIKKCLASKDQFTEKNYNVNLQTKINQFNEYLNNNYNYALVYHELNDNFGLTKNENISFYGASIIKVTLAIYIYEKAESDESILNKTITYSSKYYKGGAGVIKNNIQSSYPVRDLIKYMIEDSDNIAFMMLYNNFNINDIRNFWNNYGATKTFVGSDEFGYITANDTKIYMNELYNYLNTNTKLSEELGNYFLAASKNSYIAKNINKPVYFKYGETAPYYHEITIIKDENPYILNILTTKFPNNHINFINNVTNYVSDIHKTYFDNKKEYCYEKYN